VGHPVESKKVSHPHCSARDFDPRMAHTDAAEVSAWAAVVAELLGSAIGYGRPLVSGLAENLSGCLLVLPAGII
jgi:hypothetical protein